jgi:DNA-directed RNA polymerase III subunit RPC1
MRLLKDQHILMGGKYAELITVLPPEPKQMADKDGRGVPCHQRSLFITQALKNALPSVIVQGVPTVSRAVINVEETKGKVKTEQSGSKDYHLLVEG